MGSDLPPFYYARDHDRGPGAWCVCGPNGFKMEVPDKALAAAIGAMMSGDWERAKGFMDAGKYFIASIGG